MILTHTSKFQHEFCWDKTLILDKELNHKKRLLSEMMYTNSIYNTINKIKDIEKLNYIYKLIKLI